MAMRVNATGVTGRNKDSLLANERDKVGQRDAHDI